MNRNKYTYLHVLQGYYHGCGWEDLTQSESYREMCADIKAYRDNAPEYAYRLIQRRELNYNGCDQCVFATINGVGCHEHGCINGRVYHVDRKVVGVG